MSTFHYINIPTAAMRQHPDAASEVVSEALFSEEIRIIDEHKDWLRIETLIDNYPGWIRCKPDAIFSSNDLFPTSPNTIIVNRCAAHLYHVPDTIYGPILTLPFESRLQLIDTHDRESNSRWVKVSLHNGLEAYIQLGDIVIAPKKLTSFDQVCELSHRFLGLPYTWGGRSSFGYDCSGFVQMLYRQMGIHLPRDSKDQCVWDGFKEVNIAELAPGDLLFFGLSAEKSRHVGMHLKDGRFIHATVAENAPYIHVSHLGGPDWKGNKSAKYPFRVSRRLK